MAPTALIFGVSHLPPKLLQNITNWVYIDLSELLAEQLNQPIMSTVVVGGIYV